MLSTFLTIFWGCLLVLTVISIPYILISYEVHRRQDKKRESAGIYVRRVNRFEIFSCLASPFFPLIFFLSMIYDGKINLIQDFIALIFTSIFLLFSWYIHVAYVKISPEGVEQRILFTKPTSYPFNVIDSVYYRESLSIDDQDIVGFYTKSGKHIAAFCPIIHGNYRLLAIVRFRIENERWPDMNNSADVAQVNLLDTWGATIPFFRERKEVTGLADVDM